MFYIFFLLYFGRSPNAAAILLEKQNVKESMTAFQLFKKHSKSKSEAIINVIAEEKVYCSTYLKTKYRIIVTGSKIKITRIYKEYVDVIHGNLKNGKIFTDDPNEKSAKQFQGKYYQLKGKSFGVLNVENGDYEWFSLCKS
jgi:hypothetical protein